jgi:ketosteroid isomerase-like protein
MSATTEASVAANVRNVIAALTQAQDAGRTDDAVALYTEDGVLDVPGAGPIEGHEALRVAYQGWAPALPQLHIVSNTAITSWTAEEATAASDVAFVQRRESGWVVRLVGRYDDTLCVVEGAWLLRRRCITYQA